MMKRLRIWSIPIAMVTATLVLPVHAQRNAAKPSAFRNWPAGKSPREIGKLVAERLASTPHSNFGNPEPPTQVTYPEVATWYGALPFAQASHDKQLESQLIQ